MINSFYPVIMSNKIKESKNFYMKYFNFELTFENDWYISLKSENNIELAIINSEHSTIPEKFRNLSQGIILNIEVDNVNNEYKKLILTNNLPVLSDIKNEEFGQRHFIIEDPNGILIDIIEVIPPTDEFKTQYK